METDAHRVQLIFGNIPLWICFPVGNGNKVNPVYRGILFLLWICFPVGREWKLYEAHRVLNVPDFGYAFPLEGNGNHNIGRSSSGR